MEYLLKFTNCNNLNQQNPYTLQMNFTTTHEQTIIYKWKKNSHDYLDLHKKINPYPLRDNELNICSAFNLDVQYPHAIDISMTIHM
jgi:hypothetical protein